MQKKLIAACIAVALALYVRRQFSLRALKGFFLRLARKFIPSIRDRVNKEKEDVAKSFRKSLLHEMSPAMHVLPEKPVPINQLVSEVEAMARDELSYWNGGTLSGAVYNGSLELNKLYATTMGAFGRANLLHAENFPAARQMESEVIAMTLDLFNGDASTVGSVTSGGTESILLAVKTYRDYGRSCRSITRPNIVVPITAHAAFWKAGDYFGVEVRVAGIHAVTGEVLLDEVSTLMDWNTVMIMGSAPNYPYGTIDPIEALGALAVAQGVPLHVDACLGGFLLPFVRESLPCSCDFTVPGVSSISADTHKYAYAPKGTSILMFRSSEVRKFQYSFKTDWLGGVYATPTIAGSRGASSVVACWATMKYFGRSGYQRLALDIVETTEHISNRLSKEIPGLLIIGRPDLSIVAFRLERGNIYDLCDALKNLPDRHWHLNLLQSPAACHLAVTAANLALAKKFFVDDVAAAALTLEGKPAGSTETAAFYGATASAPIDLLEEIAEIYLDTCYQVTK